jgi:GNAT superfamily N-acetyltransferase
VVDISLLADHRDAIPVLARWFRDQWPGYYAGWSLTQIEEDFEEDTQREGLPLRLVAFVEGELAGTIVLRHQALESFPEFSPGLGGLFVVSHHRGHGLGTALVRAGMDTARAQHYQTIYAGTGPARGILSRLGWTLVKTVHHGDELVAVYRCQLATPGPTAAA